MEKKIQLIEFLNELVVSIENNNISNENLQLIGEFLMSYKYQQEKSIEYSDNLKYLSTGYYIYNIINNKN